MFSFQSRKREQGVQALLVKIANANCEDVANLAPGPRLEDRINLTLAVQVVPLEGTRPLVKHAFPAVTKEICSTGMSLVLDRPLHCENLLIGVNCEGSMRWIKGRFRHQDPIGAGFWMFGLQLLELVPTDELPELSDIKI